MPASALFAQSIRIPLWISGSGGLHDTLWFGVDTSATFCADPELGENLIPPSPPSGWFDARLISPRVGPGGVCFDQGMRLDLRPFVSATQIDTYKVRIQTGAFGYGGRPLRVSWPNLGTYYVNNVWFRRQFPLMNINMKTDTTYLFTDDDSDPAMFTIITGDPAYVPMPPIVSTGSAGQLTLTSAGVSGSVSPNGFSTTGWFEWGTTMGYGNSTTPQSLGSGTSFVILEGVISNLLPGTTYHYRCNGQNANGTTYGDDRSITTILDTISQTLIPIHVTDNHYRLINLMVGVDSSASFCLDPALGEDALPPPPAGGVFDVRLVYPRNGNGALCFDQGTLKDIRPYVGPSQVDTFKIKFQSNGYDSITFIWPNITSFFNDPVKLIDPYGGLGVNVDMKAETSLTLSDPYWISMSALLVISGNPSANRSPSVMTNLAGDVLFTSAQLEGIANPNGFSSTGWFEWGTDNTYGHTTSLQSLGNGTSVVPVAQVVSGLYPGAVYHYRVVAQNGNGTTEGPDRTFSTAGVTNQYSMASAWNMISLPMIVGDARKTVLFPTAISQASTYVNGQGFVPYDTLYNGVGYWLKFGSAQNISITGIPVARETIQVKAGWNMIGTITNAIDTSSIIELPSDILQSPFYESNGGYHPVAVLDPARGYWVKSSMNGQLVLTSGSARPEGISRKTK